LMGIWLGGDFIANSMMIDSEVLKLKTFKGG